MDAMTTRGHRRRSFPSLKDTAAEEIRRRIFSAELPPGAKVDQDALSRDLGVSRVPVREALITLHEEGLVMNVARRGAFVAAMTREDVHDHYRLIGVLSGLAAERAAANITAQDIAALEAIAELMESGVPPDEEERLNVEFHRRINHAAHSRRLLLVLKTLVKAIPSTFFESHAEWSTHSQEDHRRTINALAAGDAALARREVESHFSAAADRVVAFLEAHGFWGDEALDQT